MVPRRPESPELQGGAVIGSEKGVCTLSTHHLILVPHTHWDREWYRTHEQFRYQLVRLLDGLLDMLEEDPDFRHFTLDGQSILIDDYLEVRPGARGRLAKLVREGRIMVGPWYVLPDEWLVSGEALIRNLRLGLRKARELGGSMNLGYVPDQFGHIGQLPQIFAGFGLEAAMLWRGVGADVEETAFLWEAPDGTSLFTVYLRNGYGNAVALPLDSQALAKRLRETASILEPHSRIPTLLLMNGSDHQLPQAGLPAALERAVRSLPGWSVEIGTLPGFVARAKRESGSNLPLHRGELRSGLRAPLLPGCASARLSQKQRDFENDRLLTRYLEPLATWLAALGGDPDVEVIGLAWRIALENHPHDSICGCSIDPVHEQMESRFQRVAELAGAHLERVAWDWAGAVAVPPEGFGAGAGESLVVWNPNGGGPTEVDALIEADLPVSRGRVKTVHLRDASGRRIPARAELVEPGVGAYDWVLPPHALETLLPGLTGEFAGTHLREVCVGETGAQLTLDFKRTRSPSGYDAEPVKREILRRIEDGEVEEIRVRGRVIPRIRLHFVDDLPGHGLRVYRLAPGRARRGQDRRQLQSERRPDGGVRIANQVWSVEVAADGRVSLWNQILKVRIEDALRVVSEGDRGDEYNFDPVPGAVRVERPDRVRVSLGPASESDVSAVIAAKYRVPTELAPDRDARGKASVVLPVTLRIRLVSGLDRVDVESSVDNTARDHRLRLQVRAPFTAQRFEVESAFEIAERPIDPPPDAFGSESPSEFPVGATPQRSFATLDDGDRALTVANRGLAEVDAVPEADGTTSLAVTLLRAVGWLSRGDLRLRPGDAGPGLATPGAQVAGLHRAEISIRLHPVDSVERVSEAHRFANPARGWIGGGPVDAPLADGARLVEIDDPAVVVSAIEPRADRHPVLRLYNASAQPRNVALRWNGPSARAIEPVDLTEQRVQDDTVRTEETRATLSLRPWGIATLRIC